MKAHLHKIAHRVAILFQPQEVREKTQKLMGQGYKLIRGLYHDKTESIYQIYALSKNPDNWEPYKAPRNLDQSDSYGIIYYWDEDLSDANDAGKMIYDSPDPSKINTSKWEEVDLEEFTDLTEGDQQVIDYLDQILNGTAKRFSDIRY